MKYLDWIWNVETMMGGEIDLEQWFPYYQYGLSPEKAVERATA